MTAAEGHGIGKYVAVYLCLLVITAVQFVIGYHNIEGQASLLVMGLGIMSPACG